MKIQALSTAFICPGCFFTGNKDYESKSLLLWERGSVITQLLLGVFSVKYEVQILTS